MLVAANAGIAYRACHSSGEIDRKTSGRSVRHPGLKCRVELRRWVAFRVTRVRSHKRIARRRRGREC